MRTANLNFIAFAKANEGATGAAAVAPPVPGTITPVRMDIPVPEKPKKTGRGGHSPYEFDKLEVGASFGIIGKNYKSIASTISSANKRFAIVQKNEDGTDKTQIVERKTKQGVVTRKAVPVTEPGRVFLARDVDPKTDPEGASVRVWRTK